MLSDVITAMRTGRPHAARTRTRAPWGVRFPHSDAAGCHVVLQGSAWLLHPEREPLRLDVGDVVFVTRVPRAGYGLADTPGSRLHDFAPNGAEPLDTVDIDGSGPETAMLCAAYYFDRSRTHPLVGDLPGVIHLPARLGHHQALRSAVELLGNELAQPRAGTTAVLPALVDMLLLFVLRAWFDEEPEAGGGWVAVLRDPAIVAALEGIHREPARAWTVEELAGLAGLSRSAFAKRFTTLVGRPPLAYLTWWRMITAARLLRASDTPLRTVAGHAGYSSEFAFAKAFKREYGTAPGRYRYS